MNTLPKLEPVEQNWDFLRPIQHFSPLKEKVSNLRPYCKACQFDRLPIWYFYLLGDEETLECFIQTRFEGCCRCDLGSKSHQRALNYPKVGVGRRRPKNPLTCGASFFCLMPFLQFFWTARILDCNFIFADLYRFPEMRGEEVKAITDNVCYISVLLCDLLHWGRLPNSGFHLTSISTRPFSSKSTVTSTSLSPSHSTSSLGLGWGRGGGQCSEECIVFQCKALPDSSTKRDCWTFTSSPSLDTGPPGVLGTPPFPRKRDFISLPFIILDHQALLWNEI